MIGAIAQVEPLTRTRALRGPFDYRLPEPMSSSVRVGSLLQVPFGGRRLTGVVVGLAERSELPADRLHEPLQLLAEGVPAELIVLAEWIAREYCSTPARALALLLPPGIARGMRPKRCTVARLSERGRAQLKAMPAEGSSGRPASAARSAVAAVAAEAAAADPGAAATEPPAVLAAAHEVPAAGPAGARRALGARQREAMAALAGGERVAAKLPGGAAGARRLAERGLVVLEEREYWRRPQQVQVGAPAGRPPRLNGDQLRALEQIEQALDSREHRRILLHGVTGSGKTEVYLQAAERCLRQGRGAIVLVPEIALTPQMTGRFSERFGETVAVLHSRLSDGERYDEWRRLRSGAARICVGPRSAIFAPLADVGLVVVDEEHDSSYKHESDPRYDARAVAAERARAAGALLLFGSATPRAESAREPLARLPRRADGGPLPAVEILDMRRAGHGLHARTAEALAELRASSGKAIILLNRRGFSAFLRCGSCGKAWGCPACDVSLVLHAQAGILACHHCGHRERIPDCCECGSRSLARHGAGTERIEELLRRSFCDERLPLFRLDADVMSGTLGGAPGGPAAQRRRERDGGGRSGGAVAAKAGGAADLLARFQAAPSGILLGTQMVAKGHDFPGVSLGVVLDADATLRFPDFRAEERTFALIAQLAGRIGRGGDGRVLVQTIAPEARAIRHAAEHDSDGFLAGELARRKRLGYPPFAELVRVTCAAADARMAQRAAADLRAVLAERLGGGAQAAALLLGPAALFRLRGQQRSALLLKCRRRSEAIAALDLALRSIAGARAHREVSFSVDVDPH